MSLQSRRYRREVRTRTWTWFRTELGLIGLILTLGTATVGVILWVALEGDLVGVVTTLSGPAILIAIMAWRYLTEPSRYHQETLDSINRIEKARDEALREVARVEAEREEWKKKANEATEQRERLPFLKQTLKDAAYRGGRS